MSPLNSSMFCLHYVRCALIGQFILGSSNPSTVRVFWGLSIPTKSKTEQRVETDVNKAMTSFFPS